MTTRRRRWMDMLRRSTELVSGSTPRATADDAALTSAHGRAQDALHAIVQIAERLVGATSRHRSSLDGLLERQRQLAARLADMRAAMSRVTDAQTRLSVVALNAGLEGARVEGPAGRALSMVADEVRGLVARAAAAGTELSSGIEEAASEVARLDTQITEARAGSAQIADEASKSLASAHLSDAALVELGDQLRRATGVDPELAAALEKAQAHARELVSALDVVSSHGSLAAAAMRPVIEPLVRLLDQLEGESAGEEPGT